MLTQNTKVRKEVRHLADSADSTIRQISHAARDARSAAKDAVGPVAEELRSLVSQMERTMEVLKREGSAEAVSAGRKLQERAHALADHARHLTAEGAGRAREHMDHAVEGVQMRVAESPLKSLALAAALGAIVALLLSSGGHREEE